MRKGKEKNGRVINTGSEAELFLEDVKAQIQYKPAAERAGKELYAHMEDKAEDYRREGMPEEEAMDRSIIKKGRHKYGCFFPYLLLNNKHLHLL